MLLPFGLFSILLLLPTTLASRPRHTSSKPIASLDSARDLPIVAPRQSTDGGDACNAIFSSTYEIFTALAVYNCLITVPFNQTVATQFLKYYKDSLEFQSTLTYLKNPPSSYQQPGVDILGGLDRIQRDVDTGVFDNQYDFELEVQNLVYSAHDSHLYLLAGATSIFSFGSPFYITSVSIDGQAPPQIYIPGDLLASLTEPYTASPIVKVNGQDATTFFTQFAAINSQGYIEPNADWNNLLYSPAGDVQGLVNAFAGITPFYPGEVFSITFENGTAIGDIPWLAVFNNIDNQIPITNAQDFYNNFIINDSPDIASQATKVKRGIELDSAPRWKRQATATTTAASSTQTLGSPATPSAWVNIAYPQSPIISEVDLGVGGVLTGYILDDGVTGVLSIPNFDPANSTSFSATVGGFIQMCQTSGVKKIVIDLQQNYGGIRLLATDTFKRFFPSIDPFAGSRARAHPTADIIGNSYTDFYNANVDTFNATYLDYFVSNPWPAPVYLDAATGENFTNWPEYFGPTQDRLDFFTTIQRDNLSNVVFDEVNAYEVIFGYGNRTVTNTAPPFAAENIILLTDGLCSSTCTLFAEMMHYEAGVRTVVVGGRPSFGPMQALAGARGARDYEADYLDTDIYYVSYYNGTAATLLPDRSLEFVLDVANFNLQDQIRRGQNFPLQFAYEAANCRLFLTNLTFLDFGALWQRAADATWKNPGLCVPDSTNHPSSTGNATDTVGPTTAQKAVWAAAGSPSPLPPPTNLETAIDLALIIGTDTPDDDGPGKALNDACDPNIGNGNGGCSAGLLCVQAPFCNPVTGKFVPNQASCQLPFGVPACKTPGAGKGACHQNPSGVCQFCRPKRTPSVANCALTKTAGKKVSNVPPNVPAFGGFGGGAAGHRKAVQAGAGHAQAVPVPGKAAETIGGVIMRGMGAA
ncbi:hypothetical protein MMC34_001720 [Xylographa carneopallida]|nr:hypothetical protein [Xylographa carneopallida]